MSLSEIPANSMAIILNRIISKGKTVDIKLTSDGTAKGYNFSLSFNFTADEITGDSPKDPNGNSYVAFKIQPGTIASFNTAGVKFVENADSVDVKVNLLQETTVGEKVRNFGNVFSQAFINNFIDHIKNNEELKQMFFESFKNE